MKKYGLLKLENLAIFALLALGVNASATAQTEDKAGLLADLHKPEILASLEKVQQVVKPKFVVADDGINYVSDHLTAQHPVHYYGFVALRGQDVLFNIMTGNPEQKAWKVEYNVGGDWESINFQSKVFNDLKPGANVIVRVSPRDTALKESLPYTLAFGSYPVLTHYDLLDEPGVLRIPSGYTEPHWLTTQIYKETVLNVKFTDTKGTPLKGGMAFLELSFGENERSETRLLVSGADGTASERLDLGRCYGGYEAKEFEDKSMGFNIWKSWYKVGGYRIRNVLLGELAATPHIYYLGHICTQRVQKTVAPRG